MASPSPRSQSEAASKARRKRIRVLVADGSSMGCQLWETAFKRFHDKFSVVASASSRDQVHSAFSRGSIDVALINADLEDGRLRGLQTLRELYVSQPETPVVILLDTWRDDLIVHAFRVGAKGVFCRTEPLEMLSKCLQVVHNGQVWVNSAQMQLLLKAFVSASLARPSPARGLTLLANRETQVVDLLAEGLPNKEIAHKLGISEHTVSNYLFRIYNKLGISSRLELALYVVRHREAEQLLGIR